MKEFIIAVEGRTFDIVKCSKSEAIGKAGDVSKTLMNKHVWVAHKNWKPAGETVWINGYPKTHEILANAYRTHKMMCEDIASGRYTPTTGTPIAKFDFYSKEAIHEAHTLDCLGVDMDDDYLTSYQLSYYMTGLRKALVDRPIKIKVKAKKR